MLDYECSLALAQKMDYHYEPQCCWANAIRALRMYQKQLGNAVYIEGFCAIPDLDFVVEHGWIELEDGTILVPTYSMADHEQGGRQHYEYFPALRYQPGEVKGVRVTSRLPLVHKTSGPGGYRNKVYRAAYIAANRYIGRDVTESMRKQPSVRDPVE